MYCVLLSTYFNITHGKYYSKLYKNETKIPSKKKKRKRKKKVHR